MSEHGAIIHLPPRQPVERAPGVYDNLDAAEYHNGPGVSKSNLDLVHDAPALLDWSRDAPVDEEADAAVDVGTAFHCFLLESGKFDSLYIADFKAPGGAIETVDQIKAALAQREIKFAASAGKAALIALLLENDPGAPVTEALHREWAKGVNGRIVLSLVEMKKLQLMRDSVMAYPPARKLIESPGHVERSYYWVDEATGELCRSRHDKAIPKFGMTLDVKTTADIRKFRYSIKDYRYHVQDPFYCDGHEAVFGEKLRGFPFLVVSTTRDRSRYPVRLFSLDPLSRQIGRDEYRADLQKYAECKRSGMWPGIEQISLPDRDLAAALAKAA